MNETQQSNQSVDATTVGHVNQSDINNPTIGVHGWLMLFVVVNMYITPVVFLFQYILAWIGFIVIAEDHPGIILVGLIQTGVGGFLTFKWINLAKNLRDIVPGVIPKVRTWLKLSLAWTVLSTLHSFLWGMDVETLMPATIRGLCFSIISFAFWYSYFNVSVRVKDTYSDW